MTLDPEVSFLPPFNGVFTLPDTVAVTVTDNVTDNNGSNGNMQNCSH